MLSRMVLRRRRLSSQSSGELLVSVEEGARGNIGKIVYARKKKPDSQIMILFQVSILLLTAITGYYMYFHFDHFHLNLLHFYAHTMDNHHAQHTLGHVLLRDKLANSSHAMQLFRRSADLGHPESTYNLAAGHLSGHQTDVEKGEVKKLLQFAAANGVREAQDLLDDLCKNKPKYCIH